MVELSVCMRRRTRDACDSAELLVMGEGSYKNSADKQTFDFGSMLRFIARQHIRWYAERDILITISSLFVIIVSTKQT